MSESGQMLCAAGSMERAAAIMANASERLRDAAGRFGDAADLAKAAVQQLEEFTRNREEGLRDNLRNAWTALAMIRETLETLGPVGCVAAEESARGPEPLHEAELLVAAIRKMAQVNWPAWCGMRSENVEEITIDIAQGAALVAHEIASMYDLTHYTPQGDRITLRHDETEATIKRIALEELRRLAGK